MAVGKLLNILIALVWLANGLLCKFLNLVPRHQQIVARILGEEHSMLFTKTIGALEVCMVAWVISRIQQRLCTAAQILLVAIMNVIEFILVPDLLLFGRWNIVVATFFILILIWNEWIYNRSKFAAILRH